MPPEYRPVVFMLASTLSLSLNGLVAKFLSGELSIGLLSFLRFLIPSLIVFFILSFSKRSRPSGKIWIPLICRGLSLALCQICFLLSLESLTLVESVVLFSTGPLFIPVLEKIIFGVKINNATKLGLIMTFSGVNMLAGDISSITLRPELLYGLCAGLFNAASQLSLYRATKGELTPLQINGWGFFIASVFVLPVLMFCGFSEQDLQVMNQPLESTHIWAGMLMFSVLIINTQIFRAKAYKLVQSNSQLAPLIFTNLIFTAVWQKFFFEEVFTPAQLWGMGLIILASMIQTFSGVRVHRVPKGSVLH